MNMIHPLRWFCITAFAAVPSIAGAQASPPDLMTLDQVVARAVSSNPQVAGSRAGQREAAADLSAARASLFPKIGASESFTESTDPVFAFGAKLRQGRFTSADFALSTLNSPGPTGDYMSAVNANWTVFDWGLSRHQVRSARNLLMASEEQMQATQQSIAFAAIRAYYRALLADDEKTTTSAAVQRAQAFAKQAHDRTDTGMALVADAMQADVEVAMRKEEQAQAESNARLAYAEIAGVLGDLDKKLVLAAPTGTPPPLTEALATLQQQAVAKRPELLILHSRIAGADEMAKAGRASFGPQLSTFGNVQANNPHLFNGGASNWTVGARIDLQVFDGGSRRASISKATAQTQAGQAAYRQAETQVVLDVQRAFYSRQTAERQYAIAGDMLAKTQESLRAAQDRYGAGLVTVTEVLHQQEQLRDMEINRTQALHQWWIADAQLRLATGALEVPSLGAKQ